MSAEPIELPREEVTTSASMKCLPNEIEVIEESVRAEAKDSKKGAFIPR